MRKRTPMKGQTIPQIPGYINPSQTAKRLGISRQFFYRTGLARVLDKYTIGKNVVLYKEEDVNNLAHWLLVRRGLIALGELSPAHPLTPTKDEYDQAVNEGKWDDECPQCGGFAVAGEKGGLWCPKCGVIRTENPSADANEHSDATANNAPDEKVV